MSCVRCWGAGMFCLMWAPLRLSSAQQRSLLVSDYIYTLLQDHHDKIQCEYALSLLGFLSVLNRGLGNFTCGQASGPSTIVVN